MRFCSCDLLSVCSLKIFASIEGAGAVAAFRLWFAFSLFFEDICINLAGRHISLSRVVICFQFVLWRYLHQWNFRKCVSDFSCDLLSVCSLKIFASICPYIVPVCLKLWFAFSLFFEDICINCWTWPVECDRVVICFQFVLWRYLHQSGVTKAMSEISCDLLSVCSLKIFASI